MSDNYSDGDETNLSAAVIPNRIRLFEEIQAQQLEQLQSLPHDLIKITITAGDIKEVKEGKRWETTPMEIAVQISRGLANSALVSSVDHVLWDMNRPLEGDCSLEIFGFDSDQGRDTFWHSSAHILGQALEQVYNCKLCVWPCTTKEEGFYYDAFYHGDMGLNDDHFPYIEACAAKFALEGLPFERILVTKDQALDMFSENLFKLEIINDNLAEDETTTVYRCGPLVDLCRGPHIPNTSFVKAFKCLKASSAHWKGDKDRESLQRVYGISYPDNKQLKDYLKSIEEAKIYDHRLSGQQQELFFSHPLSPGNCIYLPHGTRVYNKLMEFFKKEYWKMGYTEVITPVIYTMDFWETSRHAEYYQKNMFKLDFQTPGSTVIHNYGIKHMNCQGHCLMFRHSVRSYNELPIKLADFGPLYQNEASEDLSGLTRVRQFQQDDAHIFCSETQVKEEVRGILDFVDYAYTKFGFTYELKLSTRPKKYLGDLEKWDKAEKDLEEALNDFGKTWVKNKGDGEFYGPKIDITVYDAMKRKFQCATIQLDFHLPDRFKLEYSAEDETEIESSVLIHSAVLGSVERLFAILLEQYKGKLPFWLSPRQAIVCSVSEDSRSYANKVRDQIHEAGYYVDADTTDRTVSEKVQEAQVAQYNYILAVGDEEARTGQVTVWLRDEMMSIETLLDEFKFKTANFL
ncbi:Threonine-tRNA ligase class IIa [Arabidopsis thaliana x Arabidopsis arenosa]|uniref:Probable threonine--tRNA ligase, cytoplasmic n=1 Tax=Arabidopsis thaliana x Arabidopsis arenosa TaxID=1240361 RepID=A0A8T2C9M2_9BRAS|nr:Threonine-tRNA ligase class IIa [Arabidopsis thaliana x Arabidopsis arenosa]